MKCAHVVYLLTPPLLPLYLRALYYWLLTQRLTSVDTRIECFSSQPHCFLVWNNIVWLLLLIFVDCAHVSAPSSPCCYIKQSFPTIDDTLSLPPAAIWLALMGLIWLKLHIDCMVEDFPSGGRSFCQCGRRKWARFQLYGEFFFCGPVQPDSSRCSYD